MKSIALKETAPTPTLPRSARGGGKRRWHIGPFATAVVLATALLATSRARAEDWTMWGHTPDRNNISPEKNPPTEWDINGNKNIKWSQGLGSKSYGNPIVANGVVYVGTNNEAHRDPRITADGGVLMAFDAVTGEYLWQRYSAKLPTGRVNDWPGEGLCSTVYAEGNRIWFCTNRCEVVCMDVSDRKHPKDVWSYDMIGKLGCFPHNMTASSIAAYGDLIYAITANGVDDTHKHVVAPDAPSIVCFNKNDGTVVWTDNTPGANVLHGQWASVGIAEVNGRGLVIAPLGDAWVYAFDAKTGKIVWKFDTNPKDAIYPQTRNEIIATPVIHDNKMYIANGQDPEHGEGIGHLYCVDITKTGDVSAELDAPDTEKPKPGGELIAPSGRTYNRKGIPNPNSALVWRFDKFNFAGNGKFKAEEIMHRTISTVAIADGLVFAPDFSGYLHCLDARTGQVYWTHSMDAAIWGSPMICDHKVYLGDDAGFVRVFDVSKKFNLISEQDMGSPVYCTPIYANGILYIMTRERLFAISDKK